MAVLLTITKIWKHPKCPSVDAWIKKLWYICTVEYYAAVKKIALAFCDSMDRPGNCYAK